MGRQEKRQRGETARRCRGPETGGKDPPRRKQRQRGRQRGTRTEHAQRGDDREEDRETQAESRGGCGERAPTPPGRRWRTPGKGEERGAHGPRTDPRTKPGGAGRGRGGAGACGSPAERGKEGPGGRLEGEGSGGAGRARGAGRKRGGAAGRGPPEKRPNFLPRQSQEAGAGTQGPGSPSPTSGAPPVTSPRGLQVHRPWPRPAARPSAARGSGGEEAGALPAVQGPPRRPSEPAAAPPWASVFPSVKGGKEGELIAAEWPVSGDEGCEAVVKASQPSSGGRMITPIVRAGKLRLRERNRLVPGYTHRESE